MSHSEDEGKFRYSLLLRLELEREYQKSSRPVGACYSVLIRNDLVTAYYFADSSTFNSVTVNMRGGRVVGQSFIIIIALAQLLLIRHIFRFRTTAIFTEEINDMNDRGCSIGYVRWDKEA